MPNGYRPKVVTYVETMHRAWHSIRVTPSSQPRAKGHWPAKTDVVDAVRVRAAEPDVAALAAGGGGGAHQRHHRQKHGAREIHLPPGCVGGEVNKPGLVERKADEAPVHRVRRRGGVDVDVDAGLGGGGAQQQQQEGRHHSSDAQLCRLLAALHVGDHHESFYLRYFFLVDLV